MVSNMDCENNEVEQEQVLDSLIQLPLSLLIEDEVDTSTNNKRKISAVNLSSGAQGSTSARIRADSCELLSERKTSTTLLDIYKSSNRSMQICLLMIMHIFQVWILQ